MTNNSSARPSLNAEASAWDLATYSNAINLVRSIREAGIPESDETLLHYVEEIRRYHRARFEEINRAAIPLNLYC